MRKNLTQVLWSILLPAFVAPSYAQPPGEAYMSDERERIVSAKCGYGEMGYDTAVRLVTTDGGDGHTNDAANWANARLTLALPSLPSPARGGRAGRGLKRSLEYLEIAPFGRVITCDPQRRNGTTITQLMEFPAG